MTFRPDSTLSLVSPSISDVCQQVTSVIMASENGSNFNKSNAYGGLRLRTSVLDCGATKFGVLQHDFGVLQHDFGVLQHDFGVLQHDFGVLQHDFGVPQHDFGVPQHDFGVPQHDFGVPQHDFGVPQHDFEVSVAYIVWLAGCKKRKFSFCSMMWNS